MKTKKKNLPYRKYEHLWRLISLTASFSFFERSLSNCCSTSWKEHQMHLRWLQNPICMIVYRTKHGS